MPGALAFVMAIVVSVGSLEASMRMCDGDGWETSKYDTAKVTTQRLAHGVFPESAVDPWGGPYALALTDHGLVVVSYGEDRIAGTADDIRSDQ